MPYLNAKKEVKCKTLTKNNILKTIIHICQVYQYCLYSAQCNDATAGNFITIPMTSLDGISPIPTAIGIPAYPTQFCGGIFGISTSSYPSPFQSKWIILAF